MRSQADVSVTTSEDEQTILAIMNDSDLYAHIGRTITATPLDPINAVRHLISRRSGAIRRLTGVSIARIDMESVAYHCTKQFMDNPEVFQALCSKRYRCNNGSEPHPETVNEERPMTNQVEQAPLHETVHMLKGRPVKEYTEDQLIQHIAELEAQILKLKTIKAKSTTIAAKIQSLQAGIEFIIDHLDAK